MILLNVSTITPDIPVWALVPFILMLLAIAVTPLVANHWWEHNKNKLIVSLVLGIPTAIYLMCNGLTHNLEQLNGTIEILLLRSCATPNTAKLVIAGLTRNPPAITCHAGNLNVAPGIPGQARDDGCT